ncbi:hypothetical protein BC567DRAFT_214523 [Phyllosticta citribraziliensis]
MSTAPPCPKHCSPDCTPSKATSPLHPSLPACHNPPFRSSLRQQCTATHSQWADIIVDCSSHHIHPNPCCCTFTKLVLEMLLSAESVGLSDDCANCKRRVDQVTNTAGMPTKAQRSQDPPLAVFPTKLPTPNELLIFFFFFFFFFSPARHFPACPE